MASKEEKVINTVASISANAVSLKSIEDLIKKNSEAQLKLHFKDDPWLLLRAYIAQVKDPRDADKKSVTVQETPAFGELYRQVLTATESGNSFVENLTTAKYDVLPSDAEHLLKILQTRLAQSRQDSVIYEPISHVQISGPAGVGKTTLLKKLAKNVLTGIQIEKKPKWGGTKDDVLFRLWICDFRTSLTDTVGAIATRINDVLNAAQFWAEMNDLPLVLVALDNIDSLFLSSDTIRSMAKFDQQTTEFRRPELFDQKKLTSKVAPQTSSGWFSWLTGGGGSAATTIPSETTPVEHVKAKVDNRRGGVGGYKLTEREVKLVRGEAEISKEYEEALTKQLIFLLSNENMKGEFPNIRTIWTTRFPSVIPGSLASLVRPNCLVHLTYPNTQTRKKYIAHHWETMIKQDMEIQNTRKGRVLAAVPPISEDILAELTTQTGPSTDGFCKLQGPEYRFTRDELNELQKKMGGDPWVSNTGATLRAYGMTFDQIKETMDDLRKTLLEENLKKLLEYYGAYIQDLDITGSTKCSKEQASSGTSATVPTAKECTPYATLNNFLEVGINEKTQVIEPTSDWKIVNEFARTSAMQIAWVQAKLKDMKKILNQQFPQQEYPRYVAYLLTGNPEGKGKRPLGPCDEKTAQVVGKTIHLNSSDAALPRRHSAPASISNASSTSAANATPFGLRPRVFVGEKLISGGRGATARPPAQMAPGASSRAGYYPAHRSQFVYAAGRLPPRKPW